LLGRGGESKSRLDRATMSNIPEDSVAWLDITALAKAAAGGAMPPVLASSRLLNTQNDLRSSADLNPKPQTPNPKPQTLNPKPLIMTNALLPKKNLAN
jgi:hypothetical protein